VPIREVWCAKVQRAHQEHANAAATSTAASATSVLLMLLLVVAVVLLLSSAASDLYTGLSLCALCMQISTVVWECSVGVV
jgi:hypothetical protein